MGSRWREPCDCPSISLERVSRLWLREKKPNWSLEDSMSWDRTETAENKGALSTGEESTIQRVTLAYSADYWSIDAYEKNYPRPGKEIFERFGRNYIQCSYQFVYTSQMENFMIHRALSRVLGSSCLSSKE